MTAIISNLCRDTVFSDVHRNLLRGLVSNYKIERCFYVINPDLKILTANSIKHCMLDTLKSLSLTELDKDGIFNPIAKDLYKVFTKSALMEHGEVIAGIKNIITKFFAEFPVILQLIPLFMEAQILAYKLDNFKLKGPKFHTSDRQISKIKAPNTNVDLLNLVKIGHTSILECAREQIDIYTDLFQGLNSPIDTHGFYLLWQEYLKKYENSLSFIFKKQDQALY